MSSFKLYLPSNACPYIYPDNSPTDFRTVFDKPIELEGNWEVGLESICYSSNIVDDTEPAYMTLKVGKVTRPLLSNEYRFRYRLKADDTWPGFVGVQPTTFESDPKKIDSVLNTLNSLNDLILTSGKAFHFRRQGTKDVLFEPLDDGLFLHLTPRLAKVLGFDSITTIGQKSISVTLPTKSEVEALTQKDYHLLYLHSFLQKEKSHTLKWNDTPFDGKKETFLKWWKENIPYKIDIQFKDHELFVTSHDENLAIEFSPHMQKTFQLPRLIIGKNTNRSSKVFAKFHNMRNEHWYVNIYFPEVTRVRRYAYTNIPLHLMPWKARTIRELLHDIGRKVKKKLKHELKKSYHRQRHFFSLTLQPSKHVTLKLGKRLEIVFSSNLAYLLGFPNQRFNRRQTNAAREVDTLFNRSRQLHVLANIVQPTTIGNQQLQILRDFVHIGMREELSVKHFDTISYVPLIANRIDNIHVQLVNDMIETVKIKDTKTLVTLFFRKI